MRRAITAFGFGAAALTLGPAALTASSFDDELLAAATGVEAAERLPTLEQALA